MAIAITARMGRRTWKMVTTLASTPVRVAFAMLTRADGTITEATNKPIAMPTILPVLPSIL